MKQLMLGNDAVARGLYESGCTVVSSYPGTPSTEITEAVATYPEVYAEWAPNEKVALEAAYGAAIAGERTRPETTLEDSYAAIRVMNAAYESIYHEREIALETE